MAAVPKLAMMPRPAVEPEMKAWIDNVIVPALVKAYLRETGRENSLARPTLVADNLARPLVSAEGSKR
jgi:hypothetical protein